MKRQETGGGQREAKEGDQGIKMQEKELRESWIRLPFPPVWSERGRVSHVTLMAQELCCCCPSSLNEPKTTEVVAAHSSSLSQI
ncbi:hypothetical protein INR49_002064 [Caranx melampygus]|nr:hypothetical protein INR49_002064 [Caranx melampygus]